MGRRFTNGREMQKSTYSSCGTHATNPIVKHEKSNYGLGENLIAWNLLLLNKSTIDINQWNLNVFVFLVNK